MQALLLCCALHWALLQIMLCTCHILLGALLSLVLCEPACLQPAVPFLGESQHMPVFRAANTVAVCLCSPSPLGCTAQQQLSTQAEPGKSSNGCARWPPLSLSLPITLPPPPSPAALAGAALPRSNRARWSSRAA